jgi:hypothetical protein
VEERGVERPNLKARIPVMFAARVQAAKR